jgi:Flp pilus assembly pilin Flp
MKPYIWIVSRGEDGQKMAEYGVVLGVNTLGVVGGFNAFPADSGGSSLDVPGTAESPFGCGIRLPGCAAGVNLCCGLQVASG